jgi:23S rRNA (pseudouridine1915-N3)-methyltransferase
MITSVELAEIISETSLSGKNTIFAVGPADGFSDEMKIKNKKISISRMTLTHEMATAILLEQLYRASEINKGTQYHRS